MVTVAIEMNANGTTTNSNMAASDQQQDNPQHPDAKLIGREFVRQYYTMLAEHPHYVHRFYSQDSIFIHCASDPIVGQTNIQKKIQELSLGQCKAKIRKVDVCEAPKKGVVIQAKKHVLHRPTNETFYHDDADPIYSYLEVLGELSCKGDPGRRFHQTFVLAQQTSKKYYLFNDIFQYAEEVFKPEDPHHGQNDLSSTAETTFSCKICWGVIQPPVIMCAHCGQLIGCGQCVNQAVIARAISSSAATTCPLCRAQWSANGRDVHEVRGLDEFLGQLST